MGVDTAESLVYTSATTIGGMLQERARGPQGADIRFLFVGEDDVPPGHTLSPEDQSVDYSYADAFALADGV